MRVVVVHERGVSCPTVYRRRWRLFGTTTTRLDKTPDEVGRLHATLLVVLVTLWSWLSSGKGVQVYDDLLPALGDAPSRRTVQRWLHRLHPAGVALQQALRTAVIERFEPQPVEMLFPGGLSPPGAVRCRRWKDPDAVYSLATALAFLFRGAAALSISLPVLLAEAHRRLDGPLGPPAT